MEGTPFEIRTLRVLQRLVRRLHFFRPFGFCHCQIRLIHINPIVTSSRKAIRSSDSAGTFSTLFAFLLLKASPELAQAAARHFNNDWLSVLYAHKPTLFQAIWDAVYNPYRFGSSATNQVLWTMQNELFGSIGIYAVYRLTAARFVPVLLLFLFFWQFLKCACLSFLGFAEVHCWPEAWSRQHIYPGIFGPVLFSNWRTTGGLPDQEIKGTFFAWLEVSVAHFSSPRSLS